MWSGNSDASWERFGAIDPYFGVYNQQRFHLDHLNEESLTEFFASGESHVNWILDVVRQHFDSSFHPTRALDFGCGVGRHAIPLARMASQVVAVDGSHSMLQEAKKNCDQRAIANVELVPSDDSLSHLVGSFDFLHSFIVFQHIPPKRGEAIARTIVDHLATGGVGALHFTYTWQASLARRWVHWTQKSIPLVKNFINLVRGRPFFYPMMQMNAYNLNRLFTMLQDTGCDRFYIHLTNHEGHLGVMLFFQKRACSPFGGEASGT